MLTFGNNYMHTYLVTDCLSKTSIGTGKVAGYLIMQVMTTTGMKTSKVMEEEITKLDPNINKVKT